MFLRSLRIENVRSIERLELDLTAADRRARKWTIVLGENGTGKSTVLRAAALVLGGSDVLPSLIPEPAVWVRNGATKAVITACISTARDELREVRLEIRRSESVAELVKRNHENLQQLDAALSHASRNYFVAGYGASRRLPGGEASAFSASETFAAPRAQAVASLFSRDATLRALDAWAMDLDYRKADEGIEMIRSAMGELLPGVTFSHIDRAARQMLFNTPDGIVSLQQLSDGYQNMASWTGDLLFRITETFRNFKRPLQARGLLLLDEIDLHLHPTWQRELLLFVDRKFPNLQILATTHSPFTAQQAAPGALHVIRRQPPAGRRTRGALEIWQYPGDPKLLRVEQLLEPLLGLETSESLAAQRVRESQQMLKQKTSRTPREERNLQELTTAVRVLPRAQAIEPAAKERLDLLERIERHLTGNGKPAAPISARAAAEKPVAGSAVSPPVSAIESVFEKMALQPSATPAEAARKTTGGTKSAASAKSRRPR